MIQYVKMTEDNIGTVAQNYAAYYNGAEDGCWTYEKAYQRIHQVMTIEGSSCCLQYDGQTLVGFLMGFFKEYDDLTAYCIEEIVIFQGCQNKGYGTLLMEKVQSDALAAGASHLELTSINDAHHMHFYEKLDFYKAGNTVTMAKHFD